MDVKKRREKEDITFNKIVSLMENEMSRAIDFVPNEKDYLIFKQEIKKKLRYYINNEL